MLCVTFVETDQDMTTITLEYNERDKTARQMIEIILSLGLATRKKSGLEEALDDVANGRVEMIHTPKDRKTA
jgi:YD repeat-containing protein